MIRVVAMLLALAATTPALCQALTNPAALNERAPAVYKVDFDTSKGLFVIEVHRDWAPAGADRC
jgi:peptidyl-prolyl cis-trans isomerase A (cyclophilin A)